MTKFEENTGAKAQWEAPELVALNMDLVDVKAAIGPGTDGLIPGGTSSTS